MLDSARKMIISLNRTSSLKDRLQLNTVFQKAANAAYLTLGPVRSRQGKSIGTAHINSMREDGRSEWRVVVKSFYNFTRYFIESKERK